MNCPNCGNVVQNGSPFCPLCNTPLVQNYAQPSWGYQQPGAIPGGLPNNGYPQQQTQNAYPTAYQQPYVYGEQRQDPLMASVSELPRTFLNSFRSPSETLVGLVEKNDTITSAIVCGVVLLLSFFAGMAMSHGAVKALVQVFSQLAGMSFSGVTGQSSQGVNLITERISASIGGISVLCQLFCMLIPVIVLCFYLNVIHKNPFSWTVALNLITVSSLPTAAGAVLCMVFSLISPVLSLLVILLNIAFCYMQLSNMLSFITGVPDEQLFVPKAVCLCVSLLLTLLVVSLVGGSLMGNVFSSILRMLTNGALI